MLLFVLVMVFSPPFYCICLCTRICHSSAFGFNLAFFCYQQPMVELMYLDYFLASFPIPLTEAHVCHKGGVKLEMQLFESNLHQKQTQFHYFIGKKCSQLYSQMDDGRNFVFPSFLLLFSPFLWQRSNVVANTYIYQRNRENSKRNKGKMIFLPSSIATLKKEALIQIELV